MDTTELRTLFRSEFSDVEEPYLVPDASVYLYIDDAQKMLCRLTEGIEDGRSNTLAIVPGTEWYDLNKNILKIRRAVDTATGRELMLVNPEKATGSGIRFDGRTGPLIALVLGIEKGATRAYPVPNHAATVALEVFRLPKTVEAGDALEVDEQHHQHLLLWVKHRAYGNQDSEVRDDNKALEYEQRFRSYCAQALREQERARRVIGTVSYGGI